MVLLSGPHLSEFGNPQLGWLLLGFTTTIAGNFTLLGSVGQHHRGRVSKRALYPGILGVFEIRAGLDAAGHDRGGFSSVLVVGITSGRL
jgi:hypothetical protein